MRRILKEAWIATIPVMTGYLVLGFGFGIILAGEKGKAAQEVVDSFAEVSFKVMGTRSAKPT